MPVVAKQLSSAILLTLAIVLLPSLVGHDLTAHEGPSWPPEEPQPAVVTCAWDGVFHATVNSTGQPLVEIGSEVDEETVVGVVEQQQRIPVFAGVRGRVIDILVFDGEDVKAGQLLYVVDKPADTRAF